MDVLIRFFFSTISAFLTLYVMFKLIPKLKKQARIKHGITVLYLSIFMTIYEISSLGHVLVYYASIIMLIKLFYKNSSFVASMSALFLYLIMLISSLISTNLSLILFSESVDVRAIFASGSFNANFLYVLCVFILLKYYQLIVRVFKKVAGTNFKFDLIMVLSNVVLFTLVILYQKLTFVNMVEFSVSGSINAPNTHSYTGYFLLTYFFITVMSMILIVLVNRIFIGDKNLERYKIKSETDLMTGALSREAGLTHLKTEMSRAIAYKYDLTIAFIDINDLKVVNDKLGHKEGDRLICAISDTIQSTLREFDVVARLGGDEFLIVFTKCNRAQAQRVWRRITEEFIRVNSEGEFKFKISASAGITQFNPVKHTSLMNYVHEADEEMYKQKKSIKASLL